MISVFKGQLSPSVSDTITVNGAAFDLTGCTVKFNMRLATASTTTVSAAATVVSAAAGTVRYDWILGDTATAGQYRAWWEVTLANGNKQDSPEFDLEVLQHAPDETTNLCTVADVRQAMQWPSSSNTLDGVIQMYIDIASDRIQVEYGKFAPVETAATKRFRIRPYKQIPRARFFPYFCTSVTAVTLHPESYALVLSATNPDWFAEPYETLDGAYTSLRLSPFYAYVSPTEIRFMDALVDVTGNWGFSSIPNAARWACIVTVRSWLRRDMATYSAQGTNWDGGLAPAPQGTYELPKAAREALSLYSQTARIY